MNRRTNGKYTASDFTGAKLLFTSIVATLAIQTFSQHPMQLTQADSFEPFTIKVQAMELPVVVKEAEKLVAHSDIEAYIIEKFGDKASEALKIAACESRFNPNTVGDQHIMVMDEKHGEMVGDSIGILQVRTGGKEKNGKVWNRARANGMSADEFRTKLKDAKFNIRYAKDIYDNAGGWSPWYNCKVKTGV